VQIYLWKENKHISPQVTQEKNCWGGSCNLHSYIVSFLTLSTFRLFLKENLKFKNAVLLWWSHQDSDCLKFINDGQSQKLREVVTAFYYGAEITRTNMPLYVLSGSLFPVLGYTRRVSYFTWKVKVQDIHWKP